MFVSGVVTCIFGNEKSSLNYIGGIQPISSSSDLLSTINNTDGVPQAMVPQKAAENPFLFPHIFQTLIGMPRPLLKVLGAFFLSWCAFSPFLILDTLWFARNVYGGTEGDAAFQEGVRMSLYNSASFSGVSLLFSLLLPFILKPVGIKVIWTLTSVLSAVCFGLFIIVTNVVPAFFINMGVALNYTIFNSIPFALIPLYGGGLENVGLYVGLFNACSLLAQAIINLIASAILILADQDVSWGIGFGLLFAFGATAMVVFLPNDEAEKAAILAASKVNPVARESYPEENYLFSAQSALNGGGSASESDYSELEQVSSNQTSIEDFNA